MAYYDPAFSGMAEMPYPAGAPPYVAFPYQGFGPTFTRGAAPPPGLVSAYAASADYIGATNASQQPLMPVVSRPPTLFTSTTTSAALAPPSAMTYTAPLMGYPYGYPDEEYYEPVRRKGRSKVKKSSGPPVEGVGVNVSVCIPQYAFPTV